MPPCGPRTRNRLSWLAGWGDGERKTINIMTGWYQVHAYVERKKIMKEQTEPANKIETASNAAIRNDKAFTYLYVYTCNMKT
jgi:hypothetical protein